MILTVAALIDLQSTAIHGLRFCQPIGGLQQPRQVVQSDGHIRMILAVSGLIDLQGTAIHGLRFCQPIGGLQQRCQVVQISGHCRMILAVAILINLQGAAQQWLRFVVIGFDEQQSSHLAQQFSRCSSYPNPSRKVGHRLGMGFQRLQHRPAAHILGIVNKGRIDPGQRSCQFMGLLRQFLPQPRYLLHQAVNRELGGLTGTIQQRQTLQLHQRIEDHTRIRRLPGAGHVQQAFGDRCWR